MLFHHMTSQCEFVASQSEKKRTGSLLSYPISLLFFAAGFSMSPQSKFATLWIYVGVGGYQSPQLLQFFKKISLFLSHGIIIDPTSEQFSLPIWKSKKKKDSFVSLQVLIDFVNALLGL
jgi:hypothetical protein